VSRAWPRPLPAPDAGARARASRTGRALASLGPAAATAWARLLELPVTVRVEPPGAASDLPAAWAGLVWPDGATGRLRVDAHLLAGVLERLAGRPGASVGPAPLTPAEEGLFAYLALTWCGLMPAPAPRLAWVHGGDPAWPVPPGGAAAVTWRLDVGGWSGAAVWWLPDEHDAAPAADVSAAPVPLRVEAGPVAVDTAPLRPGDLLPAPRLRLAAAGRPLHALAWADGRLRVTGPVAEDEVTLPSLETLPVALTVEVGTLVLPAGEVAALAPGQVVPLAVADPPVVRLCAGGRTVAVGVLVDDDGRLAVQITRAGE
jgi:hypothetical protein